MALTILGVGNVLCTDDGVGPVAVSRLQREMHGKDVAILDGGTLGLSLLPIVEDTEKLILVDAVRMDAAPGSLVILEGEDVLPAVRLRLSPHQVGVADLLDAARLRGTIPETLVLIGLVPESMALGFGLTEAVNGGLPALIDAILKTADELGYPLEEGGDDDAIRVGVPDPDDPGLRATIRCEPA